MQAHTREENRFAETILEVEDDFLALGCEEIGLPFGRLLRDPAHPLIYDVNCIRAVVGAPTYGELQRAFRRIGRSSGMRYQRLVSRDADTIQWLDELLIPKGFSRQVCVAMAHQGPVPTLPPPRGLTLHIVDPGDEALLQAICSSQDRVRRKEAWYGQVVSGQMDEMALRQMRLGGAEFFAAVRGDRGVAGSLLLWRHRGVGFIADVGTSPAYRRKGVASALVAAATSVAKERGCFLVALTARRDEAPRRIYQRLGFEPVGESVDWVKPS